MPLISATEIEYDGKYLLLNLPFISALETPKGLILKIFGFDLIKPVDKDQYYLIDLNDFPGFRGIEGVEDVFIKYLKSL